ncbi:cellulase family glycosylhydrolase [Serratia sp. AKBS12]|uniref:cellulase family glycosylhydrolase n=1 Tax=Serratia sp. AKBS12 TaxID=2974597 RepID=UPI0021656DD0|nr:cellulase family glycosylhydrolase [Serratia sp. AKBS12]MCS3409368.1 cellulase family glycosylhydrolase [Serratia sp. AKBS12]HEI8865683.1 cellulase family glycosylhydrolase [Serratia odorifera]
MNNISLKRGITTGLTAALFCLPIGYVNAFEVGINMHVRHYPKEGGYYLKLAKDYGFTSIREDYPWAQVAGPNRQFSLIGNLGKVDAVFARSQQDYGLSSMLVLAYTNRLYDNNGYPTSEAAINAFADYAYWTAKRFKGKVKYYEVWNEWLVGTGVKGNKKPPSEKVFFELVKKAALAVKKADPDAVVVTGSLNPLKDKDNAWLDKLIDLGLMQYVDGISIHPYSYRNPDKEMRKPEGNLAGIDVFEKKLRAKTGRSVPIYITEMGFPTHIGDGGVSGELAAQNVVKYTLLAKSRDYIKGIWWYDLIDDGSNPKEREDRFGFVAQDLVAKPAAANLKKIAEIAHSYQIVDYKQSENGKNIIELKKGNERATVSWTNKKDTQEKSILQTIKSFSFTQQQQEKVTPLIIEGDNNSSTDDVTPVLKMSKEN